MKKALSILTALALPLLTFGANVRLRPGVLYIPNFDGTFSETSHVGHQIRHAYFILTESQYSDYTNSQASAAAIYADFSAGTIGTERVCDTNVTMKTGTSFDVDLVNMPWEHNEILDNYGSYYGYEEDAFFAAVYVYEEPIRQATYYIAVPLHCVTKSKEEEENNFGRGALIERIALKAGRWEVADYGRIGLTLDAQGGSDGTNFIAECNAALPPITPPTKTGYDFAGYYTAANGGGTQCYDETGAAMRANDFLGATTLYAKWTGKRYVVTFDTQGGTGGSADVEATFSQAMPQVTPPSMPGMVFSGYWSEPNGGGTQYYTASGASAHVWDVAGPATLYAKWSLPPTTYIICFRANNGTSATAKQNVTYGKTTALLANAFNFSGHTFLGWATSSSGEVVYADKAAVKNLVAAGEAIDLFAKWAASKYKVKFSANGGKLPKGKKMAAQTFTYGTAAALTKNVFTKSGYVFAGWATKKNGAVVYKNAEKILNLRADGKTTTLYAVWAKETYRIAFYANGGKLPKGKTMAPMTMTYGKAKKLTANKFKAPKGKKFAGWATSKSNAKKRAIKYKNKASVKNLRLDGKTVKLYAVWK